MNDTVADQNDEFRRALGTGSAVPGRTLMTAGLAAMPPAFLSRVLARVRQFDIFTPDNDPWREHDCGAFTEAGTRVLWKIDYYADDTLTAGAEEPLVSYRVLTIMLAEEY